MNMKLTASKESWSQCQVQLKRLTHNYIDHNGDKAEKKLSTQSLPKFNEKCDKRSTLDEWVILQKMFVESQQIENTFTLWILFPFGSKCVGCR